jgi:hypothetical protein
MCISLHVWYCLQQIVFNLGASLCNYPSRGVFCLRQCASGVSVHLIAMNASNACSDVVQPMSQHLCNPVYSRYGAAYLCILADFEVTADKTTL